MRPVASEIIAITDRVCVDLLDAEYARLARYTVAKLARKRPSPLTAGRRATWAAGVVYALGQVNFLFDPATSPITVTAVELSEAFGVAKSTMGSKARQVRDLLRFGYFDTEFQRAELAASNPFQWYIEVDGLVVDARHVPFNIQAEAYRLGLIPHIPALGADSTADLKRAGAATGSAGPLDGLLGRCSELKRQLVEFSDSQRFAAERDQAVSEFVSPGDVLSDADAINLRDRFILQRPLADGRTVVEVFAAECAELSDADRELVLGWRHVVEGRFEIRERTGGSVVAASLADQTAYRVWANAGPAALAAMRPGLILTGRIVPLGDGKWMFSGVQSLAAAAA